MHHKAPSIIVFLSLFVATYVYAQPSNHLQNAIEIANPRMVKVFGAGTGRVESSATGFIVSDNGLILTRQGVFLDGLQVRVLTADGTEHKASVIRRNRELQLALLKIPIETPKHFELTDQDVGKKGDWVVAVANAFKVADKAEPLSVTLGIISLRTRIDARYNERDVAYSGKLILLDQITSNPGAAGGVILTLDGTLVGMIGKIITSSETNTRLNYAVPTSLLSEFVSGTKPETVATQKQQGEVDLGISLFKHGGRASPAYIDRVKRGSPAHKARLRPDDLVISIGGEKIGTVRAYEQALKKLTAGQEVIVIIKRGVDLIRKPLIPVERKK